MVRFDNSSVSSNYVVGNYPMSKGEKIQMKARFLQPMNLKI